jgi:recombination protein RecA
MRSVAPFSIPLIDISRRVFATIPTGITGLDERIGGLPRGAITEVFGLPSSGRTSVALSMLAAMTGRDEACALVDGGDAFDPESGACAGIDLRRLLWIRCRNLDQAMRSTDLLLQGGGFGMVAMDLGGLPREAVRRVPLAAWFRLQRVIEKTPGVLLVLGHESVAKSAAALVLHVQAARTDWGNLSIPRPSHSILLTSTHLTIEIARARSSQNSHFLHHVRRYSCS